MRTILRGSLSSNPSISRKAIILSVSLFLSFIFLVFIWYLLIPVGPDWAVFRSAVFSLLSGHNPYKEIQGYFNPPWLLIGLIPFALLPNKLGAAFLSITGLYVYGFVAYRMGAKPLQLIAVILSLPVVLCLYDVNVDWIVVLGLILPPQIGLFLLVAKPQAGIGIILYWLIMTWREKGIHEVIRIFTPVTITFLISIIIFGWYPASSTNIVSIWWNISFWPYSLPIGVLLFSRAIRAKKQENAIIASVFLTPYVSIQTYSIPIFGLLSDGLETFIYCLSTWLVLVVGSIQ